MREKVYHFPYDLTPELNSALTLIHPLQKNDKITTENRVKLRLYSHLPTLIYALEVTNSINMLDSPQGQEFFEFILQHNPEELQSLACVLEIANNTRLFAHDETQNNFHAIINHEDITKVSCCLEVVYGRTSLLSSIAPVQANFKIIIKHENLEHLFGVLSIATSLGLLGKAGDLTSWVAQLNFDVITSHKNLESLKTVLRFARITDFLATNTQENFCYLTALTPLILNKIKAILLLENVDKLLIGAEAFPNFCNIIYHKNIQQLQGVLKTAHEVGLFTRTPWRQTNFHTIVRHENLGYLGLALSSINNGSMLTTEARQSNFEAIATHPNLPALVDLLIYATDAGFFSHEESAQKNFMEVIEKSKHIPLQTPKTLPTEAVATKGFTILRIAQLSNAFFQPLVTRDKTDPIAGDYRCKTPMFE